MSGVRCFWVGHAWRLSVTRYDNEIRWSTWVCRHCPALIELAAAWGAPVRGGVVSRADGALIGLLVVAAVLATVIGGRP